MDKLSAHRSSLSTLAAASQTLGRLGLLTAFKLGQRLVRRRVIVGAEAGGGGRHVK